MNDMLGRPIKVGDTIITNYPFKATFGLVTKVLKVNKSSILHSITRATYSRVNNRYDRVEGTIRKRRYQVLVVNEQIESNHIKFPEAFL